MDKFGKNDGVSVKNDKGTKGNGKNSKSEKHNKKGEKSNSEGENVLSNIATLIQSCIDNRTMNNKTFKKRLDTLYKNSARPKSKYIIYYSKLVFMWNTLICFAFSRWSNKSEFYQSD